MAALAAASLALVIPGLSTAAQADPVVVEGYGRVVGDYFEDNLPVTVRAYKVDPKVSSAPAVATEVSNDGSFTFPALTEGATWLKVTPTSSGNAEKVVGPYEIGSSDYNFGTIALKSLTGTLTGKVLDVAAVPYGCAHLEFHEVNSDNEYTVHTGADGTFSFTGRIGAYKLLVDSDCGDFKEYWIGGIDKASGNTFTVALNKTSVIPTFSIKHDAIITGKVVSDAVLGAPSVPLRDIDVQALKYDTDLQLQHVASARTGLNGAYKLEDLSPGQYILRFTDPDGEYTEEYFSNSATPEGATGVNLLGNAASGKNVSLAPEPVDRTGEKLAGIVKNRSGSGIDKIEVNLYNIGQDRYTDYTVTNRHGRFSFRDLEPGTYQVSFGDYDDRYLTDGTTSMRVTIGATKGADISRTLVALASVSGTINIPANLKSTWDGGRVALFTEQGDFVEDESVDLGDTYEFDRLKPGRYKVRFGGEQYRSGKSVPVIGEWWSKKYSMDSATVISLGDGGIVKNVNATLTDQLTALAAPKITGTAKRGKTLRANVGVWNGAVGTKFTYVWLRGGKAIKGATKPSYKLAKADRNKSIKVKVTASNPANAWKSGVAYSATKRVAKK